MPPLSAWTGGTTVVILVNPRMDGCSVIEHLTALVDC